MALLQSMPEAKQRLVFFLLDIGSKDTELSVTKWLVFDIGQPEGLGLRA